MTEQWEKVNSENDGSATDRLRVPGGWLYRCTSFCGDAFGFAMVFVPAPISAEVDLGGIHGLTK